MAASKSRARDFKDPDENLAQDYDPEGNAPASDQGSDSELSEDPNAGTEHYLSVGRSRLRQKEGVSLGPDYKGSRVSRSALEDDDDDSDDDEGDEDENAEYDDPETVDVAADEVQAGDSEIESDNALAESDAEHLTSFTFRGSSTPKIPIPKSKTRATAADFMSSPGPEHSQNGVDSDQSDGSGVELDDSDEDDESGVELDGSDEKGSSDGDAGELESCSDSEGPEDHGQDEDSEDPSDADSRGGGSDDEKADKSTQASVEDMQALANQAEVKKGIAIQKQRKVYDGLLNLRIRLQKALVAANTFPLVEEDAEANSQPYEAAEEAAVKLLNTISSLRTNLVGPHKAGDKRKRALDASVPSEEIWARLQEEDLGSMHFRKSRLEKWSRKVQSVNVTAPRGMGQRSRTVVEVIEEQLGDPDRLVKRTRVPRSCAPAQAAKNISQDEQVYDDADFYQLLLKELVDQRTVETTALSGGGLPTVMLTAAKANKTRKQVDRKASKGRKMRFTVHEKLQNFMAPEDRRTWEQQAIDGFFATLFGRKMVLQEDDSEMEDADGEEQGLRLFRS